MSIVPDHPASYAIPRPGVVKALGICNIVFAAIGLLVSLITAIWFVAALTVVPSEPAVKVEVQANPGPATGSTRISVFNPFMGMGDKKFVQFSLVEHVTGMITSGVMFATGIGLVNLRGWAARWWAIFAWIKIALAVALWGYFIVAVAPSFSESMAKEIAGMFRQQGIPPGRAPSVGDLTRIYSIMCLFIAVGAIVFASIYPTISLVLLGRPGIKAALIAPPVMEPEPT